MDKMVNMQITFETKAIKAQIAKYFDEQHQQINELIENEVTPEKILLYLKACVEKEMANMIQSSVRELISTTVRYNADLQEKISKQVTKASKKIKF